jgi:hypothetical protein
MFRFIVEYSNLRDFGPYVIGMYEDFFKDDILACVEI